MWFIKVQKGRSREFEGREGQGSERPENVDILV